MPFQNIYSLSIGWIQRPFSYSLWCLTFKQTMHPHAHVGCTCSGSHFPSLVAVHAHTHSFTAGIPPFLMFPSGSCLWLISKLGKKNKYSSNSSHPTLPAAGSVYLLLTSSHTPLWFNTPDTALTPFSCAACALLSSFASLFLPPSYLNLSPYILPSALLNLFLNASFLLTNFRSSFSN